MTKGVFPRSQIKQKKILCLFVVKIQTIDFKMAFPWNSRIYSIFITDWLKLEEKKKLTTNNSGTYNN